METDEFFTAEEKRLLFVLYRKLLQLSGETLRKGDCRKLKTHLVNSIQNTPASALLDGGFSSSSFAAR